MYDNMDVGIFDIILRFGLTVATGFLFGIVFLSYWRTRTSKMLLISIGFAVFFVHALITIPELFNDAYMIAMSENLHLTIHLVALVFILLGILKD
jgi:tetrahydromethanopterin S-methyltransferase subunit E